MLRFRVLGRRVVTVLRRLVFVMPLALAPLLAGAQAYPSKPVKLVVPYPAGGLGDTFARALGRSLGQTMKQPVIVENMPGASQIIGAKAVARATPDGYTLFFGSVTSLAINVSSQKNLPYDPQRDFQPISLLFNSPLYFVAGSHLPVKSVKDVISLARSRPGTLTFASIGDGSSAHLAGELFKKLANIEINHIPYKGTAPAMNDLMAGHVDLMFEGGALSYADSGKTRLLATSTMQRAPKVPDIQTMNEAGVPGYDASLWFAMVGPAGLPSAIVEKLNKDIQSTLANEEFRSSIAVLGVTVTPSTPKQLEDLVKSEIGKWKLLYKDISK